MEFEEIDKASLLRLIITTKTSAVPALARMAAVRLYKLGKKKYAIDFLIKQMNLYKLPTTHRNTISETCPEAAKELGRLGDDRAIDPLFEALAALGYGPAFGLAQIGGHLIEKRLAELAKDENKVAVFAAVCLGYMKNKSIVPRLIYLLEHHDEYEKVVNDRIARLGRELRRVLGSYKNNALAERCFKEKVEKSDIDLILMSYLHQEKYPSQRWLEWEIVGKYGWNSYIKSEKERFVFRHISMDRWGQFSHDPFPFATAEDMNKFREQILSQILSTLK